MKSIWQEIKSAFPFLWAAEVQKVKNAKRVRVAGEPPRHINCRCVVVSAIFNDTGETLHAGQLLYLDPDQPGSLTAVKPVRRVGIEEPPYLGRDMPEPVNLAPYYIAVVILAALLVFHGLACEFGLVNYAPILGK